MQKVTTTLSPTSGLNFRITDCWKYRELYLFFALRDIKLRYRHVGIAFIWATIPPILMSTVFDFTLGKVISASPAHIPYLLFAYLGLIFWNIFSSTVYRSSNSLLTNQNIITKIYQIYSSRRKR